MILIDKVYQVVMALANKEQRGYITPQEFNLFANKAQSDIYEGYIHDFKTLDAKPKTNLDYADERELVETKLQPFRAVMSETCGAVGSIEVNTTSIVLKPDGMLVESITDTTTGQLVTKISYDELVTINNNPLTKPTKNRRVYHEKGLKLANGEYCQRFDIYPHVTEDTIFSVNYLLKPSARYVNWGYVVVKDKALYNSSGSVNFWLHPLEENNLVHRILQLAGVSIQKGDLIQAAITDKQQEMQDNNN
jgi:hypothetical protein